MGAKPVTVLGQVGEQFAFPVGQGKLLPCDVQPLVQAVEGILSQGLHGWLFRGPGRFQAGKQGFDTDYQFLFVNGLFQVIDGPHRKPLQYIDLHGPGRKENKGQAGKPLVDLLPQCKAVYPGHHHVQDQQVKGPLFEQGHHLRGSLYPTEVETLHAQIFVEKVTEGGIVLHQ